MSKRNSREIYSLTQENEGDSFFDLSDKNSASAQHSDRFSYAPFIYKNERNIEKTEENQS